MPPQCHKEEEEEEEEEEEKEREREREKRAGGRVWRGMGMDGYGYVVRDG